MDFKDFASNLFLEDVEMDKKYREKAERMFNKLVKELKEHRTKVIHKVKDNIVEDYYIKGEDIGFDNFIFYFKNRKYNARYAELINSKYGGDRDHGLEIPVLYKSDDLSTLDDLHLRVKRKRQDLIHEFIHALDHMRANADDISRYSPSYSESKEGYFNSDMELNSYYQEAIFGFEEYIESQDYEKKREFIRDHASSFEDFKYTILQSFMFDRFYKNLTKENKRRIIKRLYKYYNEDFTQKYSEILNEV